MSVGTGRALGVSMSKADIDGGTITGATLTSNTMTGNTVSGGAITSLTGLTTTTASTVGLFGATAVVQPANAAQSALTLTTVLQGASAYGFTTNTGFTAFLAQLENIRASLVLLGALKGSA